MNKLSFNLDKTKAVLIGTSEYASFSDIPQVESNLEDLKDVLLNPDIIGLATEDISILLNKEHHQILTFLSTFVRKNIDLETLILFFAGHGERELSGEELFLISKNSDKEFLEETSISFSRLKNLIEKSSIQQRVMIFDCCYSGIATMSSENINFDSLSEKEISINGTYVLASSGSTEKSYFDTSHRNTYFTGNLLNIFHNGIPRKTSLINLEHIYEALQQNLKKDKNLGKVTPRRKTNLNVTDFFIAKNSYKEIEKWNFKTKEKKRINVKILTKYLKQYNLNKNSLKLLEVQFHNLSSSIIQKGLLPAIAYIHDKEDKIGKIILEISYKILVDIKAISDDSYRNGLMEAVFKERERRDSIQASLIEIVQIVRPALNALSESPQKNSSAFVIKFFTKMHVGSGFASYGIIDNLVSRDPIDNLPTIYAPSLKGALREHFETNLN